MLAKHKRKQTEGAENVKTLSEKFDPRLLCNILF